MQLQERGLLSLTDSISKYLPEYPQGDTITIHQLLSHTSGIPDLDHIPALSELQRKKTTPFASLNYFQDLPLDFAPGSDCKYSNPGYIVLGAIIELVSKQPYEQYLTKNILLPLGLKDTHYAFDGQIMPNHASGYRTDTNGEIKHADFIDLSFPHASRGLSSSAEDLFRLTRSFKGNVLLQQQAIGALFTVHGTSEKHKNTSYGLWL